MERPLAIVAVLLVSAPALAGPGEDHFAQGQRAEEAGLYAVASAEYLAAYGELSDPRLLFYVARAYEREGLGATAAAYYERYLREVEGMPAAHRAEIEAKVAGLTLPPPEPNLHTRTEAAPRVDPPGMAADSRPSLFVEVPAPPRETPPIGGGRLIGEFLLGNVLGAVGGGVAVAATYDDHDDGTVIGAGLGGYALGSGLGVYMVGAAGDQTGSFGATFLGSAIGTGVGFGIAAAAEDEDAILFSLILPTIGAMIGFNATREYEERAPSPPSRAVPFVAPSRRGFTAGVGGSF